MAPVPTRAVVFDALYQRFQNLPGFVSVSKRMILPAKVQKGDAPTLRLWPGFVETKIQAGRLPVDEWDCAGVIYIFNDDSELPGAVILDPLIDAVRDALKPNVYDVAGGGNDLGLGIQGLYARIEGITAIESGDTTPNYIGTAIIPIKITVPRA